MKLIFLTTLTILIFSCGGMAQKKDSIPPVRKYTFEIDSVTYSKIDSILVRAYQYVGKPMLLEEGELLKGNFAAIINFFQLQTQKQNAIKPKK